MDKESAKKEGQEIVIEGGLVLNPPYALAEITTWISILKPNSIIIVDGTVMEILDIKGQRVRIMVKTHKDNIIHLRK